jgi:hypothetical protein
MSEETTATVPIRPQRLRRLFRLHGDARNNARESLAAIRRQRRASAINNHPAGKHGLIPVVPSPSGDVLDGAAAVLMRARAVAK